MSGSNNSEKHYPVFVNAYLGVPRNHHGIFVELEQDGSGFLYHVEGSVQTGMRYNPKPAAPALASASLQARRPIGWVPASLYPQVHAVCSTIPPPAKQYDGPKLLVPKNKLRRCQEWTNEAIHALRAHGVLLGNEGPWVTREQLEEQSGGQPPRPASKGNPKASSSQPTKSQSSSTSSSGAASKPKSGSSSTHSSTNMSSASSDKEPADGAVSADKYWVYSRKAKDWYHVGADGKTITWKKQVQGKAK